MKIDITSTRSTRASEAKPAMTEIGFHLLAPVGGPVLGAALSAVGVGTAVRPKAGVPAAGWSVLGYDPRTITTHNFMDVRHPHPEDPLLSHLST